MTAPQFIITVAGVEQGDMEELEEACRQLRDDLEEIDGVDLAEVPGEPPPPGTRSSAFVALSAALMVGLYGGKMAVMAKSDLRRIRQKIANVLDHWMRRHEKSRAIIKLPDGTEADLTGYGPDDIVSVLERVTGSTEDDT